MKLSLRARAQPEVNLTSLIDVVLLLLIFFMVSTSFVKQSQIEIRLPETDSTVRVEEVPESIDLMITLRKVSGGDSSLPLTISADANAKHQFVVTSMDVAGRLGFTKINIATVNDPVDE